MQIIMTSRKNKIKKEIKLWAMMLAGCFLRGFGIYVFVRPNNFAPGGITGVSTMLDYALSNPLIPGINNTSLFLILTNIPTIIIAYFVFSRVYAIKTTIASFTLSASIVVYEKLEEALGFSLQYIQNTESSQPILAAISAGVVCGVALAMIFLGGGSNGGTDVLGAWLSQKYPHINASWFVSVLDSIVIVFSFFVFRSAYDTRLTPVVLALINAFCTSKVCDMLMHGLKKATKFEVVTPHGDELSQDLIKVLGRTVTRMDAEGMYTHQKKSYLVCVVRNRQIPLFYDVLKKYPDTFAYLSSTSEVIGRGFTRKVSNVVIDLDPIKEVDKKLDITQFVDDEDEAAPVDKVTENYEDYGAKLTADYILSEHKDADKKKKRK